LGYYLLNPFYFPEYLHKPIINSFVNAILLCVIVSGFSILWSIPAALLLNIYEIKFKKIWISLLILPIAVPSYLNAYVYSDLLYYTGKLARWYYDITGFLLPFNIHSLIGAGFVLSLSLYPYIFFSLYLRFKSFPVNVFDYARTVGHKKIYLIWTMIQSSMPVILFGLSLITLETLSDYGTVSYYGVQVPSLFLFDIWQQTGNMTIAMNITCIFLLMTGFIFSFSYYYQIKKDYDNKKHKTEIQFFIIKNFFYKLLIYSWLFFIIVIVLIIPIGFFIYHFLNLPFSSFDIIQSLSFNSFSVALVASIVCVIMGLCFSYYHYHSHNRYLKFAIIVCSSGYAFPNVILGIAVYGILLFLNHNFNHLFQVDISVISGSVISLILCYYMKFLTVSYGCFTPIYKTISPSLFQSALVAGYSHFTASRIVYWSFFKKPIMIGFILVIVDILKELPITLLVRPFGFETFATYTYNMASLERIEEASVAALVLIFMGILAALIPITTHIIKDSNS
jgi:iron(III) transport system permease protein